MLRAPVGVVSLLLLDLPPRPSDLRTWEGYVLNLYLELSARRQGIARSLLDAPIAYAAALDPRRLLLQTTDDGRPLYEQAGFATHPAQLTLRLPAPPSPSTSPSA